MKGQSGLFRVLYLLLSQISSYLINKCTIRIQPRLYLLDSGSGGQLEPFRVWFRLYQILVGILE